MSHRGEERQTRRSAAARSIVVSPDDDSDEDEDTAVFENEFEEEKTDVYATSPATPPTH